ncbi:MAG: hypothetical protein ACR2RA_19180 [Geminicoccaceae bacterium]
MTDRAQLQLSRRKVRDRSIALALVGTVVLMPPVAGISLTDGSIGGIPVPILYVFVIWSALIAGAAALGRPLLDTDESASSAEIHRPGS